VNMSATCMTKVMGSTLRRLGLSFHELGDNQFRCAWCTVPSPALTKRQSQHMVGPLQGPMEEGQQVDRSSHRLVEASPK